MPCLFFWSCEKSDIAAGIICSIMIHLMGDRKSVV